jgi:hypothetical protein
MLVDLKPQKCQEKNYHHSVKRVSISLNYTQDIIHSLAFRNKLRLPFGAAGNKVTKSSNSKLRDLAFFYLLYYIALPDQSITYAVLSVQPKRHAAA